MIPGADKSAPTIVSGTILDEKRFPTSEAVSASDWKKKFVRRGILVCSGCYNKYLRLGILNNRNLFSQLWRLEV